MNPHYDVDDLETATSLVETLTGWAATNLDRAKTHDQDRIANWEGEVRRYESLAAQLASMTPAQVQATVEALAPIARRAVEGTA